MCIRDRYLAAHRHSALGSEPLSGQAGCRVGKPERFLHGCLLYTSGMTNVTAITGRMSVDSAEVDAYIVYGETDYAYYSMALSLIHISLTIICQVDAPMDLAASMTPASTSFREDSTIRPM